MFQLPDIIRWTLGSDQNHIFRNKVTSAQSLQNINVWKAYMEK